MNRWFALVLTIEGVNVDLELKAVAYHLFPALREGLFQYWLRCAKPMAPESRLYAIRRDPHRMVDAISSSLIVESVFLAQRPRHLTRKNVYR